MVVLYFSPSHSVILAVLLWPPLARLLTLVFLREVVLDLPTAASQYDLEFSLLLHADSLSCRTVTADSSVGASIPYTYHGRHC